MTPAFNHPLHPTPAAALTTNNAGAGPPEAGGNSPAAAPPPRRGSKAKAHTNNAGAGFRQPPQRDPIFRDAKVLLFWCDQQQKEYWLGIPLCRHREGMLNLANGLTVYRVLISASGHGAARGVISNLMLITQSIPFRRSLR